MKQYFELYCLLCFGNMVGMLCRDRTIFDAAFDLIADVVIAAMT